MNKDVAGKKTYFYEWWGKKKGRLIWKASGGSSKVGELLVPHLRISQMDKTFKLFWELT